MREPMIAVPLGEQDALGERAAISSVIHPRATRAR
jgi:hypothetical protein